ncbi:hypothetical protein [Nocardia transvalensis]|uniref:hypothetical protein n=1 Tax=Nocardia transvalensis TaxID=37333 RepID=UPI0018950FA3|nr:hypothetical protein [Nocardia transvalensis]MBF6331823.1 hypothetical protein [Nocardia transvalensis]
MTHPEPASEAMSVQQWQERLLQRIHDLAAEHTRVTSLGYDETDPDGEQIWRSHLDALAAQREHTEQTASSAGTPPHLIEWARLRGSSRQPSPNLAEPDPRAPTPTAGVSREFLVDKIHTEWLELRTMALLNAARNLRTANGKYAFGADPVAILAVERTLSVRWRRIAVLAGAAGLGEQDGNTIWTNNGVEDMRRLAAATVEALDDLALEEAWKGISRKTEPEIPVEVPVDPQTGKPVGVIRALPPTIEELDAHATAALTIAEHTRATKELAQRLERNPGTAVEAALPHGVDREWTHESNTDLSPPTTTAEIGREPD